MTIKQYLIIFSIIIVTLACLGGVGIGLYLVIQALYAWSAIAGGIGLGLVIIYFALTLLSLMSNWIDNHNKNQGE